MTVPYAKIESSLEGYLSRSGHVEPRLNLRGPSRKAKYSLTTDSKQVGRPKGGKNPVKGRILNLKPCAYKRSEHLFYGVTACLLQNDPASYSLRLVKALRAGATGKPSLNRATLSWAVDAKLRDLPMSRLKRGLNCVEDRTHLG